MSLFSAICAFSRGCRGIPCVDFGRHGASSRVDANLFGSPAIGFSHLPSPRAIAATRIMQPTRLSHDGVSIFGTLGPPWSRSPTLPRQNREISLSDPRQLQKQRRYLQQTLPQRPLLQRQHFQPQLRHWQIRLMSSDSVSAKDGDALLSLEEDSLLPLEEEEDALLPLEDAHVETRPTKKQQRLCFNCGSPRHLAAACDKPDRRRRDFSGRAARGDLTTRGQTSPAVLLCHNCGVEGHKAAACPLPPLRTRVEGQRRPNLAAPNDTLEDFGFDEVAALAEPPQRRLHRQQLQQRRERLLQQQRQQKDQLKSRQMTERGQLEGKEISQRHQLMLQRQEIELQQLERDQRREEQQLVEEYELPEERRELSFQRREEERQIAEESQPQAERKELELRREKEVELEVRRQRQTDQIATLCYNCGKVGHKTFDCPKEKVCYNCGQLGHFSRECPDEERCHRCGRFGHKQVDCPEGKLCFKCGCPGHLARFCNSPAQ